jgi:hypothetical protein
MYRPTGKPWTLVELKELFSGYFGDKLSPLEVDRLARQCAAALAERGRCAKAPVANGRTSESLRLEDALIREPIGLIRN